MAEAGNPYGGYWDIGPDVNPNYMQLPAKAEEVPMPHSPDGWAQSKIMAPAEGEAAPAPKPAAVEKKKPAAGPTFTPEQAALLQRMTSVDQPKPMAAPHGGAAGPRSQVGQMQQLSAAPGGVAATAPRASLGQIIYGGRKF